MKRCIWAMALVLVLVLAILPMPILAENSDAVAINEKNFPDSVFRKYVSGQDIDVDQDGYLSEEERNSVVSISLDNAKVYHLTGIAYFENLTYLSCNKNRLEDLDLSKNTKLQTLTCFGNQLYELDLSQNTQLQRLDCSDNRLRALDVRNHTKLISLSCYKNRLPALDVSSNVLLERLNFDGNRVTNVDVSKNVELLSLSCSDNALTALDVSANGKLEELVCDSNKIMQLDLSSNTSLKSLFCGSNELSALDLSILSDLVTLRCGGNYIPSLDVRNNQKLEVLECQGMLNGAETGYYMGLKELDVSNNPKLTQLYCDSNQLTELDLSHNPELTLLSCGANHLTQLDVSNNSELTNLECSSNQLVALDLSSNEMLHEFLGEGNQRQLDFAAGREFDLSTLAGFDAEKASNWQNATLNGTILTVEPDAASVSYDYDCGNGMTASFTLETAHEHRWTAATCTFPKVCATCGTIEGEKGAHIWSEWTATIKPTEDADGTAERQCEFCHTTETKALSLTKLGDVNADGKLNAKDATAILKYIVNKLENASASFEQIADVNRDDKVNAKDATKILKTIVGKDTIEGSLSDMQKVHRSFSYSDEVFGNPLMGYAPRAGHKRVSEDITLLYMDITWRELEPEEGVFAWEEIEKDNQLARWREEGKHIVLRFLCDVPEDEPHIDIPDWLYDKIDGAGTKYHTSNGYGFSPDYANADFIAYHKKAVEALGEYFGRDGFISYIELGSLGHWGEWHVRYAAGIKRLPNADVREQYVTPWIEAFPNAKIMMRRPFASAEKYGLGLYNDMAGHPASTEDWFDWIANGGKFSQTGEKNALVAMPDFWKTAPSGGELTHSIEMQHMLGAGLQTTVSLIRESHTTFLGPNIAKLEYLEGYETLLANMGYRLWISDVTLSPELGGGTQIKLTWRNAGVAPMYFDWDVCLYVMDENSEVVEKVAVGIKLTELLPDGVIETKTVLNSIKWGNLENYTVKLGIVDPMTGKDSVRFAVADAPQDDGTLVVWGKITENVSQP